jgi:F-type H+-transporting ATPase subunit a
MVAMTVKLAKVVGIVALVLAVWSVPASRSHAADALSHVLDSHEWHLFTTFEPKHIHLPLFTFTLFDREYEFQITKFMVLQLIAAGLIMAIFIPLCRRAASGEHPKGAWWNSFEALLTFIRDQIAKPALSSGHDELHDDHHDGHHADHHKTTANDYDKYVPFLWTIFLFVLFNNLLGMMPFGASATGSIYVTGALALVVFFAIHGSAVAKMGLVPYVKSLWPQIDVPFPLGYLLKPMIFVIEVVGVLVKNAVLAVRLFANMFAGHMVLATILLFITMAANTAFAMWATITLSSVLGIIALSLLEIFVAFLQAYIFTFLTALFMGMALHPQH